MKNKIQKFSKGDFRTNKPEVIFEDTNLVLIIGEGEIYRGSIRLKSNNGNAIRGLVYPSSFRMQFRKQGFEGTDCRVEFAYDGRGLPPGHYEQGKVTVVCSGGEFELPFTAVIEKPYVMTPYGKIQSTDDFRKLAMQDYMEAVRLFRSKSFYEILKYENERILHLYDHMRKWSLSDQALEEFLVGIKQKECIFLTLSGEGMLFEDVTESTKGSLTVLKNTWGYMPIRVEHRGDFLKILRPEISTDDFVGNSYELEYLVLPEYLHAGKNFGEIRVTTPYETITYDVEVLQTHEYDENHHLPELMLAQIVKEYISYNAGRIELKSWTMNASERLSTLRKMDSLNEKYQLLQAHVYVIGNQIEEAKWILENYNYNRFSMGKDPVMNCYYLFLTAKIRGKSSHTDRVLDEIGNTYLKYQDNWQLLQMLIHLDPRYRDPYKRLEVLEQQFEFNCHEVLFYLEAFQCYKEKPGLLKKLGKFETHVLGFAAKYRLMTKELALYIANFASQQKYFREDIFRILVRIYDMFPEQMILNTICTTLIKGNKIEKKYFRWYQKSVNDGMKIAELFEYYMLTMDTASIRGPLPRSVFLYFKHGNHLDYKKKAFLYANLLTYEVGGQPLFLEYREQMAEFTWQQLKLRHITDGLRVLYKRFCQESEMNEERIQAMSDICYSYSIQTKVPNMNYVLVIEKNGEIQQRVPYDNKAETVICLKDKQSRIVWESASGRFYTDSIPYETQRLFYEPRFLEMCKKYEETEVGDKEKNHPEEISYEAIKEKGISYFPEEDLFGFCSRQVRESNYAEDSFLLLLCYECLLRQQYDKATLLYLANYYCGATKDMVRLWKIVKSYDIPTYKLGERILTQMLFSENLAYEEEIFEDYYKSNNAYFRLQQAYLAYSMKEYLVNGRMVEDVVFEIIMEEFHADENLPDICKIAILKYYAEKSYPPSLETQLHRLLCELCEKQLIFPFYQSYKKEWLRELQLYDKAMIAYQAEPQASVKLYYKYHRNGKDELGYRMENLLPTYENLYVKLFVLYADESVQYYIEETDGKEIWTSDVQRLNCQSETEAGKYGKINEILRLSGKERKKAMAAFSREERVADQLFKIF